MMFHGWRQPKNGLWQLEWKPFLSGLPERPVFQYGALALLAGFALLLAPHSLLKWTWGFPVLGTLKTLVNFSTPNDHAGDTPYKGAKQLSAPWSKTYVATASQFGGATKEATITNTVAAAITDGASYVLIPAKYDLDNSAMLPYNTSLVTNLTAFGAAGGKMVREGGDLSWFDVKAYGAAGDAATDDTVAIQAAINAVPVSGGLVYFTVSTAYMISNTLVIPTDRTVILKGEGGTATNSGGLLSQGSVIKRISSFTGTMVSQVAAGATTPAFGMRLTGLVLDGNNVAGDLLVCTQMQNLFCHDVVFFNSNGNGLLWTGVFNSFIDHCRFFELGNTTVHPNGTSSLVLNSNTNAGTVDVWITQPHFESGRGSYMTSNDPTGTHPIDGVCVLGGKMEWTGNFATGFNPPAASAIAMPFLIPNNGINWLVYGLFLINGNNGAATHLRIQNCSNSRFYTNHETATGLADNQLPTYYVDLFSGSGLYVSGIFNRGAQNGTAGAHIRVVESSVTGYQIDPGSQFISPASGTAIKFTNPTAGKSSFFPISGGIGDKLFALTSGVSPAVNAQDGNFQTISILTNIAVVIPAPSNHPASNQSMNLEFEITNSSGGPLTTPPDFATGANAFLLTAGAVNPANGQTVYYSFRWSAQRGRWMETGRTIAF